MHKQPNPPNEELVSIPTKISDGLFMADQYIAQDSEWLQMNQVTHIINCAGRHCKNNSQIIGVNFLTYQWSQTNIQNILDQNVIGASINFIEQAKKIGGSVLVHCSQSQSRPFCILAAYLMIRYQWNLFKTLQFLNSRKEDIELQPAFFQQLTSLHQKLQEKGLIKSRNWVINELMSDEQIILTNTFLNSRKKQLNNKNQSNKQHKKSNNKIHKKVNWKPQIHLMHVYSPLTILSELNPQRNSKSIEPRPPSVNLRNSREKQRAESLNIKIQTKQNNISNNNNNIVQNININGKEQKNTISREQKIMNCKEPLLQKQKQSLLQEINVTKKWAELRESWMKDKQNNQGLNNIENSRKTNDGLYSQTLIKKEQKISDRIQEKLNLIKSGYEAKTNDMIKRRDHTPITGKKVKDTTQMAKTQRQVFITRKEQPPIVTFNEMNSNNLSAKSRQKQKQKPQTTSITSYDTNEERINKNVINALQSHNYTNNTNSNINSTLLKSSVKQLGNKSVIIVKPNAQFNNFTNNQYNNQRNFDTNNQRNSQNNKQRNSQNNNQRNNPYNNLASQQFYNNPSNCQFIQQSRISVNSNSKHLDKNTQSRNSLRKGSTSSSNNYNDNKQNKPYLVNQKYNLQQKQNRYSLNKENINQSNSINKKSKFFRNEKQDCTEEKNNSLTGMVKMRSSSTRPVRKDDLANSSIMKNNSYSGKGKWKF